MPASRPSTLLALGLAAWLGGCGGVTAGYEPTTPAGTARAARAAATVRLYTLRPARPYTVVGYLRVRQQGWGTAPGTELLSALRDEGARRGCDAVVLDHGYCVEEPDRYSVRSATASVLVAYCVDLGSTR